jgi:uncharacterized protein YndB with AHSA1/START domain
MTFNDTTAKSQTDAITFEFELNHPPEKVWRALTTPELLAQWLLPVFDLKLEPGAAFTFKTQAYPGWDGTVNCRFLEIEPQRKLSYSWTVPFLDTVVTFTLTPTATGTAAFTRAESVCLRSSAESHTRSVGRAISLRKPSALRPISDLAAVTMLTAHTRARSAHGPASRWRLRGAALRGRAL